GLAVSAGARAPRGRHAGGGRLGEPHQLFATLQRGGTGSAGARDALFGPRALGPQPATGTRSGGTRPDPRKRPRQMESYCRPGGRDVPAPRGIALVGRRAADALRRRLYLGADRQSQGTGGPVARRLSGDLAYRRPRPAALHAPFRSRLPEVSQPVSRGAAAASPGRHRPRPAGHQRVLGRPDVVSDPFKISELVPDDHITL